MDYKPLCHWLTHELQFKDQLVRFELPIPGLLMKTLQTEKSLITILINKSDKIQDVPVLLKNKELKPNLIFSNKENQISGTSVLTLQPEETLVIEWK